MQQEVAASDPKAGAPGLSVREKLGRIARRLNTNSQTIARLKSDIEDFDAAYSRRIAAARSATPPQEWAEACHTHLANAKSALSRFDIASGYQSLLNAERGFVPGMTPQERCARVISLRKEVEKKLADSWRGKAAKELLTGDVESVPIEAIQEAMFHVNTRSQNAYQKIGLLKRQLIFVALILFVLLAGVSVAVLNCAIPGISGEETTLFLSAIVAGLFGGALSAAISTAKTDPKTTIPDVKRSAFITLARTVIGAAAAIPTYLLIKGGLFQVTANNHYVVLFFCFLSGFSERWFLARLDTQSSTKKESEK
ncbi:MAG: hypothetical protein JSW10_05495 [Pseudomonadota bacterium]|nr:MAG: hypothetical protein JSW10_05495 [Pseudomonadota bacterium]